MMPTFSLTQRWLSRDPIEERGGINIFAFVGNRPTESIDLFGLLMSDRFGEIAARMDGGMAVSFGDGPLLIFAGPDGTPIVAYTEPGIRDTPDLICFPGMVKGLVSCGNGLGRLARGAAGKAAGCFGKSASRPAAEIVG